MSEQTLRIWAGVLIAIAVLFWSAVIVKVIANMRSRHGRHTRTTQGR